MATRKPLEQWQREDAARLFSLWEAKHPMPQEVFGSQYSIGGQSVVSQYLNGKIPLNLTVAVKFADALSVDIDEISPTLAKQLPKGLIARQMAIGKIESSTRNARLEYLAGISRDLPAMFLEFMIRQAEEIRSMTSNMPDYMKKGMRHLPEGDDYEKFEEQLRLDMKRRRATTAAQKRGQYDIGGGDKK